MKRVGIVAWGGTQFTMEDRKVADLMAESARDLLSGMPDMRGRVDAVIASTSDNEQYLAPIVSELAGMRPRIAHTVENMCSSGTSAIVSGYSYIASGLADMALVVGAERHNGPGRTLNWDISRGEFKKTIFWASILTKSYKRRFGISANDLAIVPVKNRAQAAKNPNALCGKACTENDVATSLRITDDLRLFDCSRLCSGAAAVLLASEDAVGEVCDSPAWITGVGQKTLSASFSKLRPLYGLESVRAASEEALQMSGRTAHEVDVAEVHDAFSVCEPMALESAGMARPGSGVNASREAYDTGSFRINPRGGLIGAGHPTGATGIAQAAEIAQQVTGQAGPRQVDGAHVGLVQNMSAAATSSSVLVVES